MSNEAGGQGNGNTPGAADNKPAAEPKPTLLNSGAGDQPEGDKPSGDKSQPDPGGDKKPADTKDDDDKAKDAKDDKAKTGAPEKYEDFKMPEGVQVDKAALEQFTPLAKELNLSQDQAQKIVDQYAKLQQDRAGEVVKQWNDRVDGWRKATEGDKEYGGTALKENLAHATRFRDAFATPELRSFLEEYQIGNHPEVVRLFVRAGKAMSEDQFKPGNAQPKDEGDRARRMYPSMPA